MRLLGKRIYMPERSNYAVNGIDNRLLEIFGEEQCRRWKNENPSFLDYQTYELENGFIIEDLNNLSVNDITLEKIESYDPVNFPVDESELILSGRFNPMRYNVRRSYISRKYYSIGNTGKVLVLFSGEELRKNFNSGAA